MKLIILGGSGDMGSYIVRDVIKFGKIWTRITIADINEKRSRKLIAEINDPRLDYEAIDARNHNNLVKLLKNYDIACSAIGPYYIFGPKIIRAAIEAKIPLVDICDDPDPTAAVLEMDEDAKNAQIPIFIGYGWTPGLTNLMAKHAYDKLDRGHPVHFDIAWAGGAADSEGLAVIMHVFHAITGSFPSYQDGKLIDTPAGKGNVRVNFPAPLGTIGVFDCGHPEPVTIPRFLPEVERCTLKGGLTPDWNNKASATFKHFHLLQGPRRKKYVAKFTHLIESLFAVGGIAASSARVDIYGIFKDKPVHWVYCTPSITMGELTGYPAAIAAQLYAEGKISEIGVLPPEALSGDAPNLFFDEMKKRNIEMIFDENDPLEQFSPPEAYTPGLISKYGLTILVLLFLAIVLFGVGWLILTLFSGWFLPNLL